MFGKEKKKGEKKENAVVEFLLDVFDYTGFSGIAVVACLILGIVAFVTLSFPNNVLVGMFELFLIVVTVHCIVIRNRH